MELDEFEEALKTLAAQCENKIDFAMRITKPFAEGKYSKDFMIACLKAAGINADKLESMSDDEARKALQEAYKEDRQVGGESGQEETAEKNNRELEDSDSDDKDEDTKSDSENEDEKINRLFGLK